MALNDETTPERTARAIVAAILGDLTDRAGLDQAWAAVNEDDREEIKREWEQIAFEQIGGL
jgi:hypothetical protein